MNALPRIALTVGEPAGIGPDLCALLASEAFPCEIVVLADKRALQQRAAQLGLTLTVHDYEIGNRTGPGLPGELRVLDLPCPAPVTAGMLNKANAAQVISMLKRALAGTVAGEFSAIVTAPVHKGIINDAGIAFSGHTEFFAEHCGAPTPVMLLIANQLRVALATTHLALQNVSAAITATRLDAVFAVLQRDLPAVLGIAAPRVAVCGLNPHAGESGHLGREEIEVITPAIHRAQARGLNLTGPLPADTVFVPQQLRQFDVVLAMYHDQGLPVLKHAGFGHAVNLTLGLPIVRTSVDHGTALDLAGGGRADAGSLRAALRLAIDIVARRTPAA